MFENMTWKCHICGATRPDAKISVLSREKKLPCGAVMQENIKYCNDNPDCRGKAKTFSFSRTEVEEELLFMEDVLTNINNAIEEMDGDDVARAHNSICSKQIKYDEDSVWIYTGEED